MRLVTRLPGLCAVFASLFVGVAGAGTLVLTFPESSNTPSFSVAGPFPQPPLNVGTVNFTVPIHERVVAASISGFWGTTDRPEATAGVDVFLDGVLVARCLKPSSDCWEGHPGQRSWSYTLTEQELKVLNDGSAKLTAVQTSDDTVRLGVTTLIVQTGPLDSIPTLTTFGFLLLTAGLALTAFASRRRGAPGR